MADLGTIDKNIVARYIGMKESAPDESLFALMDEAEKMLIKDAEPAHIYKRFALEKSEKGICLSGTALTLPGNDIAGLLKDCNEAILLCATLGSKVDARIRKLSVSDVAMMLVYDAAASVAVDNICDGLESEIKEKLPDTELTMRFSPGYGDLPLELQESFLNVLDTKKRAGVSLTEGGMLTPVKTVTAVIGLKRKRKTEGRLADNMVLPGEKRGCGRYGTCKECKRKESCLMAVTEDRE